MDPKQASIAAFGEVLRQAQRGELSFEALSQLLEAVVGAGNLPLAALLYREWHTHRKGEIRIQPEEHARVAPLWARIQAAVPDLPELPAPVGWLKFTLHDGRRVEYRDIDDPYFNSIIERVSKHTITMLEGVEPPWMLYKAIEHIVKHKIPGDLVECGVWNGGSVLLMALALQHFGDTSRRIWLYDTFAGMPKPDDVDRNWDGVSALPTWEAKKQSDPAGPNWGFGGTVEMVEQVVYASGYPRENFVFVKGMVEDTIPGRMPAQAALVRLDTDFYASTYHELVHLYPALVDGGVLIIDDYGYFQGARIATDQYLEEQKLPLFLSRVTQSVRLAIKPGVPQSAPAAQAHSGVDETSYRPSGNFADGAAALALGHAYTQALALDHKLPDSVMRLRGMSGRKYRYLINRLIERTAHARYLEVGAWAGSTVCAASWGNAVKALCIDNWSEFGGPREEFLANISAVRSEKTRIEFLEADFRNVDFSAIGRFNVYLFDGPHAEQDQYDGVVLAQPALEDEFTLIVDDWNWAAVRQGTQRAIADLGLQVVCSVEIRSTQHDGVPQPLLFEKSEWHNGYFIAVCRKRGGA